MIKQKSMALWVGLLMLLAALGLAFLALQVSGLSLAGWHQKYYSVTVTLPTVDNLKVRSPVRLAGVQIGRVTAITLDPKSLEANVGLRIEDKFDTLPIDTTAALAQSSLLGDDYIRLMPGVANTYLKEGGKIQANGEGGGGILSAISNLIGGGSAINPRANGQSYYHISEQFPAIGGLTNGAEVKISGVKVGQVSAISLDPVTFLANVTMSIDKRYANLPIDSIGQIASISLLGGNYINLIPGALPQNVQPGSQLEKRGIAPTDLSNLISTFMNSGEKAK